MAKDKFKRVVLNLEYVVRAGDDDMIQHAKDCLYEDIMSAYKNDELYSYINVVDAPDAKEEDIPEFLLSIKTKKKTTDCINV